MFTASKHIINLRRVGSKMATVLNVHVDGCHRFGFPSHLLPNSRATRKYV